ncbi:MAG: hypothetical protein A2Z95_02945 [Gallionellales bacterium GWA2_60_18]|nr:MAG: hypothetical protein A2Z95_02945 [Gallionellales bacterium GWA2_60_18]
MIWLFNIRHQVNITIKCHDKNGLVWIFLRVRVAQFIQHAIRLNSKCYYLERNITLNFQRLVFIVVPAKWFHLFSLS